MLQLVDVVSVAATATVIFMELGPAPAVREILAKRDTGLTPLVPLVALGTNGWIWTMYGYLGDNIFPVAFSNFVGAVLSVVYTAIFYRFTRERAYAHKVIGFFATFVALATLYAWLGVQGATHQTRAQVHSTMGVLGILTVLMFFASPFENIALVFRHKTGAYIPILLVSIGAVNCAMWSLYGALTSDWILFAPNFGALMLGLVQIALYFVFHPSKQLGGLGVADPASAGVAVKAPGKQAPVAYGAINA